MKLYGMYAPSEEGSAWRNESDLPPETLEPFERVWDADAPERCRGCNKGSAEHSHPRAWRTYGTPYCSRACKSAGLVAVCEKCCAKVDVDWPRCYTCKWGF